MMLAASISLHLGGTTEEQPTQQGMESLARSGLTLNPMIIRLPMLVITTSAGILMIQNVSGAFPMKLIFFGTSVKFPSAPL